MLTPRPTQGDTQWFVHDRFGMFIHWGLYALPARHEWVQSHEEIAPEDYRAYFERFDPALYDPRQWARLAREAGMKYVVLTTKHHEGFCLWDSAFTDYKVTNTPYGKDLLAALRGGLPRRGAARRLLLLAARLAPPGFPHRYLPPAAQPPEAAELNTGRDVRRYAEYLRNQVRELLTGYGPVDILWCDFSYPGASTKACPARAARTGRAKSCWR